MALEGRVSERESGGERMAWDYGWTRLMLDGLKDESGRML